MTELARRTAPQVQSVIAISEHIKDLLLRPVAENGYGYPTDTPIGVIHEGIDVDRFKPDPKARADIRRTLHIPMNAPVIGTITRLHPLKDFKGFLMVAAAIKQRHPNAHFVVAGNGLTFDNDVHTADGKPDSSLAMYLDEIQNHMGVNLRDGSLHLLGQRDDMPALLNSMDILTSTSQSEGFGRTVIEAKAVGVPTVVTDAGPMPVLSGRNGRVIPKRDITVDQKIAQLPSDAGSENAIRELWRTNLAWASDAASKYEEILSRRPKERENIAKEEVYEAQARFTLEGMSLRYSQAMRAARRVYDQQVGLGRAR